MAGTGQTSDGVIPAHPVRQHVRKTLDKLIANEQAARLIGGRDCRGGAKKASFRWRR